MRRFFHAFLFSSVVLAAPVLAAPTAQSSSPDALITSRAKLSLWTTAGVKSTAVHVDTDDGVVTLYGKVPTDAQRALAEKTAAGITGVRSVRNLLQVVPPENESFVTRADKDIKEVAEKQLKADAALGDSKIRVKSVDDGVVLLSGDAKSWGDSLRAVKMVDRIVGVKRVASEVKAPGDFAEDERIVQVAPGARPGAADMRTSMDVKIRLLAAPQVPSTEISVDTDAGVVTLFGIVPSMAVKTAAGTEAAKAFGVERVDNQLEVVPSADKKFVEAQDADIARDLALAFKDQSAFKDITTTVKNGTVRATGKVSSSWEALNALRIIRRVAGVRSVENEIKIDDTARAPQSMRR